MDLSQIKKQLRPDTSVLKQIEDFVSELNQDIKKNKIKAECVKGGSVAKGTFLRDDYDVDLFVRFDYSYKDENLSVLLKKILNKYKPELVHGSRDYFHLAKNNLNYEIVPVLKVDDSSKIMNVTDMSPLHVKWVKDNLKQGMDDDIRITKKFCKTTRVYGAESYINGFSGHVIDILIIHYGSFMKLLKESQKWEKRVIIDPEKYYKTSRDILFNLNQSKIQGPVIIIDPIDKTRNAASALSYEKFAIFKKKSKEFLKKPSEKFFKEEIIGKTYLKKKFKKNLYILTLKAKDGKKDVVGSKIVKAYKFLKAGLKDFDIKNSGWEWNDKYRVLFWFVFNKIMLDEKKIITGPPLDKEEHIVNFKEKYSKTFTKNKQIFAEVKVDLRTPEENITELSKKEYFKKKISLIKTEKYI